MTEEELLALYALVRKEAEGMTAREEALRQRTLALNRSIEQLQQLPLTLGKQTSEYIAMGVRQAIQDDFRRPIETAVKGPLEQFSREVSSARHIMAQVGEEARFQSRRWMAILVLIGVVLGWGGSYFFFGRDLSQVNERLDSIQRQVLLTMPLPDVKPAVGSPGKGHHGSHILIAPSAP
jgi:hypothetical protein